ncbi:transposase [Enterococcus faecalis]|nr:transposase [Enterococcus faecalis]TGY21253.1 transposase [Enterococcus faecalis]
MVTYNYLFEFKFKLVHNYLSGQGGLRFLAKKYGVKNNSQSRSNRQSF